MTIRWKEISEVIITKCIWREQRSALSVLVIFEAARGFEEIELQHLRNQILEEYTIQETTLCTSIAKHCFFHCVAAILVVLLKPGNPMLIAKIIDQAKRIQRLRT